jgi:hypothetical protein
MSLMTSKATQDVAEDSKVEEKAPEEESSDDDKPIEPEVVA